MGRGIARKATLTKNAVYCFYCIHGYFGSGKAEYVGGRWLVDCSEYE